MKNAHGYTVHSISMKKNFLNCQAEKQIQTRLSVPVTDDISDSPKKFISYSSQFSTEYVEKIFFSVDFSVKIVNPGLLCPYK